MQESAVTAATAPDSIVTVIRCALGGNRRLLSPRSSFGGLAAVCKTCTILRLGAIAVLDYRSRSAVSIAEGRVPGDPWLRHCPGLSVAASEQIRRRRVGRRSFAAGLVFAPFLGHLNSGLERACYPAGSGRSGPARRASCRTCLASRASCRPCQARESHRSWAKNRPA